MERYWEMAFPEGDAAQRRPTREYAEELRELLVDAARIRLRADVPVGAYLSGGLDSSTITAIVRTQTTNPLETFSIAFTDGDFDESGFQLTMAEVLGTRHHVVRATHDDIGAVFPEVVWHAETPLMRTAPAPMFLLSGLVRENRYKVVLSGEGADELLAGYDLFHEARIRRFWAEQPESTCRPGAVRPRLPVEAGIELRLRQGVLRPGAHQGRRPATTRTRCAGGPRPGPSASSARTCGGRRPRTAATSSPRTRTGSTAGATCSRPSTWRRASSSRSTCSRPRATAWRMGHSVEGRYPFLDHRVVEFSNRLPASLKLNGLTEKYLLKEVSREWLPAAISDRPKQPYRAPVHRAFFNDDPPEYVDEVLSRPAIEGAGYFNPSAVDQLVAKLRHGRPLGETDDMALAGIVSTQLLHRQFVADPRTSAPLGEGDDLKVVARGRSN